MISGLLLAAGESTRMGTLKALLEWEGTTLLEYQVAQLLAARLGEVVVVLGHEAERLEDVLGRPNPLAPPSRSSPSSEAKGSGQAFPAREGGAKPLPLPLGEGWGEGRTQPTDSPLPGGDGIPPSPAGKGGRGVRFVYNPDYRSGKTSSIRAGVAALSADATGALVLGVDQPRPRDLLDYLIERHGDALLSMPFHAGHRGHPPIFSRALFPELLALSEEREGLREMLRAHAGEVNLIPVDSPIVHLNLNRPEDYAAARA